MRRRGMEPVLAGLLVLGLVVAVVTAWIITSSTTAGPRIQAVVAKSASLRAGDPVRIAGVDVGEVDAVAPGPGASDTRLTLRLDEDAPLVRGDARLAVRPRLFLEGGWFVDLQPGSPTAAALGDATLPRSRTGVAVQLDEVLSALQADPRRSLGALVRGWGTALTTRPTAAEDRTSAPESRGQDAAGSLNDALADAPIALRDGAVAAEALRGRRAGDAARLVAGLERVASGLGRDRRRLASLVEGLDRTTAAFAARRTALADAVAQLPRTLDVAGTALRQVDRALPPVRALARAATPGLRAVPAAVRAATPWAAQARRLLAPAELRTLAADLRPASRDLARTTASSAGLLASAGRLARCATRVLIPTANTPIDDGALSTGVASYKELLHAAVGFTGEGMSFDGNGTYVRFQPGGGPHTVAMAPRDASGQELFGHTPLEPLGTRPAFTRATAAVDASGRCEDQPVPTLAAAPGPADGTAAR
ncbi:MlaD family protein [Conexibacter sp. SYSU D00693]|uniref:MlaD family protein n=1 Tax=Conexibacter sp. SYSU D00693 TaxID=2812560 RepID=UPI00196B39E2|nr:MlaD family protein [Conexibacter sp. SYSU D00693]